MVEKDTGWSVEILREGRRSGTVSLELCVQLYSRYLRAEGRPWYSGKRVLRNDRQGNLSERKDEQESGRDERKRDGRRAGYRPEQRTADKGGVKGSSRWSSTLDGVVLILRSSLSMRVAQSAQKVRFPGRLLIMLWYACPDTRRYRAHRGRVKMSRTSGRSDGTCRP